MGIEFGPPPPAEWLEKARASGFKDLSSMDLDRRQKKILKEICDKKAEKENNPIFNFENWESDEDPWNSEYRAGILEGMDNLDRFDPENPPPKYRQIAKRVQRVRKDRGLTVKQFAEALYKPADQDPHKGDEFNYTSKQIHALEYGTVKIDQKIADLIFDKFQVSQEWILFNKGVPHTKTNVLTGPRLNSIETRLDGHDSRLNHHSDVINQNVGVALMEELEKQGDKSIAYTEEGKRVMLGCSNAKLRVDLNQAQEKISSLENQISLMNRLMVNMEEKIAHIEKNYLNEQMVNEILDAQFATEPPDIERDPEGNPL